MVVFTCNHCGDTLQKPKVAKHYDFRCHNAPFLTCVDCLKDFRGNEFVSHTKCITEAERYGGKDYVAKAGANKGERKQQEWLTIVNSILNSATDLSNAERNFLNTLSKYENIPRKKAKFLNFIRSAMGQRVSPAVVESVWDKMETTYKNSAQNTTEKQQQNGNQKIEGKKNASEHQVNNIIDNQNNENIDKENQNEDQQIKNGELHNIENGNKKKKKKSKKRVSSEIEQSEVPVSIETNGNGVAEEPVPKKKKKSATDIESTINQSESTTEKPAFDWKATILDVVQSKGEISMKKLQKKVISQYMNFCSNSVTDERAATKFNKKLKKVSGIVISDEKITLA